MSLLDKELYAATCNPPRRAKRPRTDAKVPPAAVPRDAEATFISSTIAIQPRPILPKRASSSAKPSSGHVHSATASVTIPSTPSEASATPSPVTPGKRGRKPGPLSRSAREAQRRLNHSIIEKARRTKINNALATLKQLVPIDYGKKTKSQEENNFDDDDDDDDDDDGDQDYGREKKIKPKASGKKEEKEREYKLEILVRTVAFMQDLLQRVAILEQTNHNCSNCGATVEVENGMGAVVPMHQQAVRSVDTSDHSDHETTHRAKRPRVAHHNREATESLQPLSPTSVTSQQSAPENPLSRHRLPSISSWLPETLLDPSIFNVSSPTRLEHTGKDTLVPLQLPTPPASTHFYPCHSKATADTVSTSPPTFPNTNTHHNTLSPTRTPEDESAATMLLQISGAGSSPTFRPLPPSIFPFLGPTPAIPPPLQSHATKGGEAAGAQAQGRRMKVVAVQTPASLLGLISRPLT